MLILILQGESLAFRPGPLLAVAHKLRASQAGRLNRLAPRGGEGSPKRAGSGGQTGQRGRRAACALPLPLGLTCVYFRS